MFDEIFRSRPKTSKTNMVQAQLDPNIYSIFQYPHTRTCPLCSARIIAQDEEAASLPIEI